MKAKKSYKVRDDYKEAVSKHLEACTILRDFIENEFKSKENKGSSLSAREQRRKIQLLEELYYLTGYVIECSCCMAIFHHFPSLQKKGDLKAKGDFRGKNNISFKKASDSSQKQKEELNNTFFVADSNHKLTHFKNVSQYMRTSFQHIDVLNGYDSIFKSKNCDELYKNYEAEVRYNLLKERNNIELSYENVFNFLEVARQIYSSVKENYS